jgi:hypothetical protein
MAAPSRSNFNVQGGRHVAAFDIRDNPLRQARASLRMTPPVNLEGDAPRLAAGVGKAC